MRKGLLPGISCLFFLTVKAGIATLASSAAFASVETDVDFGHGYDTLGFSYSIVPVYQNESEMDNGGSFTLSSAQLRLSTFKLIGQMTLLGASFSYNHIDYNFTSPAAFAGQAPWDRIRSIDIGLPLLSRLNEKWALMLAPSIGSYGEYDANQSDSRTYGVVAAAGYTVEKKRRIGFGLAAFDRLGQNKIFPFVSINWQLTDELRLSNPQRAGPTGAAGLELAYTLQHNWEAGAGFARRNLRFQLDDSGIAANGAGEHTGRLIYARVTKKLDSGSRLGIYLGTLRNGRLEVKDQNDNSLASTESEASPMLSLSFEGRF